MNPLFEQLGPLADPLLFCSVAAATLILERLIVFLGQPRWRQAPVDALVRDVLRRDWQAVQEGLGQVPPPLRDALGRFLAVRIKPAALREELARLWLTSERRRLVRGLGLLMLLAVVSPLLGLLGTLLGMIEAFRAIAAHTGPIHPALLADGLWEAMLTTAVGLFIAIPALLGAHGFRLWAGVRLDRCEAQLNRVNLALEGLDACGLPAPLAAFESPRGQPA